VALKLSLAGNYRATEQPPDRAGDQRLTPAEITWLEVGTCVRVSLRGVVRPGQVAALEPSPPRVRFGVVERDSAGYEVPDLGARLVRVRFELPDGRRRHVLVSARELFRAETEPKW